MKIRFFAIIVLSITMVVSISACSLAPTQEEQAKANHGIYPTNYESIVRDYMYKILKDPGSAHYEFINRPQLDWGNFGDGIIGVRQYGYSVCLYVNSKNSFGGYTGNEMYYFFIRDNSVIYHSEYDSDAAYRCKGKI